MAFFQSSEERQRHRSTDTHIEATRRVLTDPAVASALGTHGNNSVYFIDHFLYVPNIRDGQLVKPKAIKESNAIAAISLHMGESVRIGPEITEMMPLQKEQYLNYLGSIGVKRSAEIDAGLLDRTQGLLYTHSPDISIALPNRAAAMVAIPSVRTNLNSPKFGRSLDRRVKQRPTVVFKWGAESDPQAGLVGVHEMTHVQQTQDDIVQNGVLPSFEKTLLGNELKAYHIQAIASASLYHRSPSDAFRANPAVLSDVALRIDTARREENKDRENPYEPTGRLRNLIKEQLGTDIIGL